jgi:hypothetical protein
MKSLNSICLLSIKILTVSKLKKDYNYVCENTVIFPAYTNSNNQYVPQEIVSSSYSNTISSRKKDADSDCKKFETSTIATYQSAEGQGQIKTINQCGVK